MRGIRRALLVTGALALLPGRSFADDPYADYRIPEHYWRSWTANLLGSGSRNVANSFVETTAGTLSGSGSTSLYGGYDSDARSSFYTLILQADGGRQRSTVHDQFIPRFVTDRDAGQQRASQYLAGSYAWSRFPWAAPLGYALSASATGGMNQSWSSTGQVESDSRFEYRTSSNGTTGEATGTVFMTASLSWGRVRDATPIYQVQVLEQRLLDMGTITRPLSAHAREQLGALYTVQFDVSFAHQRPTKYFWRELERLLTEDGVLGPAGLDAYAVQRLVEPLAVGSKGVPRARGFAVGPQVTLNKSWSHSSSESATSNATFVDDTLFYSSELVVPRTRTDQHDESILSGAFVDYHHPFGMRWQVDGTSQGLLSESGATLSANSTFRATWQVADRWFFTSGLRHLLTAPGHGLDRRVDHWRVTGDASVNYFFEDAWAFQLGYTHLQDHKSSAYSRQDAYTLGVTFQFAGWLYAPGLFQPMRLSPPAN